MPRRAFGDEPNKGFLATFRERLAQNAAKDKRLQADLDELRKMKEASEAFKKAKEESSKLKEATESYAETVKKTAASTVGRASKTVRGAAKKTASAVKETRTKAKSAAAERYRTLAEQQAVKNVSQAVREEREALKRDFEEKVAKPMKETPVFEAGKKAAEGGRRVKDATAGRAYRQTQEYVDKVRHNPMTKQVMDTSYDTASELFEDTPLEEKFPRRAAPEAANSTAHLPLDEETTTVAVRKKSAWEEKYDAYGEKIRGSRLYSKARDFKDYVDTSNNPVVRVTRAVGERVASVPERLFPESEQAQVIGAIRKLDPNFTVSSFLKFLKKDFAKPVMEASLKGDVATLGEYCTEAPVARLRAEIQARMQLGTIVKSRFLDVKMVDFSKAQWINNDIGVVVTLQCHQTHHVVDKQGATVEGGPDQLMSVVAVWVMTLLEEGKNGKPEWKIVEFVNQGVPALI